MSLGKRATHGLSYSNPYNMKYGLTIPMLNKLAGVFCTYPDIERVVIFGARARGTYLYHSDINLALLGPHLDVHTLMRIEAELDKLFLPHKIDVCLYDQLIGSDLVDHIRREGKVMYDRGR